MLYTPWPYNVIYPAEDVPQPEYVATSYGFAEGVRSEKGFRVGRLITTDLSVYLKQKGPGSMLEEKDDASLSSAAFKYK